MTLDRLDHVAIEVDDLDAYVAKLTLTGGLRVLRRGTAVATGARIALLGDRVGMKIELVENGSATGGRFLHVAFRSNDVDAAVDRRRRTRLGRRAWPQPDRGGQSPQRLSQR